MIGHHVALLSGPIVHSIDIVGLDSQSIPSAGVTCMMNPRWHHQPGKKLASSITRSRFLDILDGLTAAVQQDFLKIDHYCRSFELKMRRVGLILINLSSDKDFKKRTFCFKSLRGLLDF